MKDIAKKYLGEIRSISYGIDALSKKIKKPHDSHFNDVVKKIEQIQTEAQKSEGKYSLYGPERKEIAVEKDIQNVIQQYQKYSDTIIESQAPHVEVKYQIPKEEGIDFSNPASQIIATSLNLLDNLLQQKRSALAALGPLGGAAAVALNNIILSLTRVSTWVGNLANADLVANNHALYDWMASGTIQDDDLRQGIYTPYIQQTIGQELINLLKTQMLNMTITEAHTLLHNINVYNDAHALHADRLASSLYIYIWALAPNAGILRKMEVSYNIFNTWYTNTIAIIRNGRGANVLDMAALTNQFAIAGMNHWLSEIDTINPHIFQMLVAGLMHKFNKLFDSKSIDDATNLSDAIFKALEAKNKANGVSIMIISNLLDGLLQKHDNLSILSQWIRDDIATIDLLADENSLVDSLIKYSDIIQLIPTISAGQATVIVGVLTPLIQVYHTDTDAQAGAFIALTNIHDALVANPFDQAPLNAAPLITQIITAVDAELHTFALIDTFLHTNIPAFCGNAGVNGGAAAVADGIHDWLQTVEAQAVYPHLKDYMSQPWATAIVDQIILAIENEIKNDGAKLANSENIYTAIRTSIQPGNGVPYNANTAMGGISDSAFYITLNQRITAEVASAGQLHVFTGGASGNLIGVDALRDWLNPDAAEPLIRRIDVLGMTNDLANIVIKNIAHLVHALPLVGVAPDLATKRQRITAILASVNADPKFIIPRPDPDLHNLTTEPLIVAIKLRLTRLLDPTQINAGPDIFERFITFANGAPAVLRDPTILNVANINANPIIAWLAQIAQFHLEPYINGDLVTDLWNAFDGGFVAILDAADILVANPALLALVAALHAMPDDVSQRFYQGINAQALRIAGIAAILPLPAMLDNANLANYDITTQWLTGAVAAHGAQLATITAPQATLIANTIPDKLDPFLAQRNIANSLAAINGIILSVRGAHINVPNNATVLAQAIEAHLTRHAQKFIALNTFMTAGNIAGNLPLVIADPNHADTLRTAINPQLLGHLNSLVVQRNINGIGVNINNGHITQIVDHIKNQILINLDEMNGAAPPIPIINALTIMPLYTDLNNNIFNAHATPVFTQLKTALEDVQRKLVAFTTLLGTLPTAAHMLQPGPPLNLADNNQGLAIAIQNAIANDIQIVNPFVQPAAPQQYRVDFGIVRVNRATYIATDYVQLYATALNVDQEHAFAILTNMNRFLQVLAAHRAHSHYIDQLCTKFGDKLARVTLTHNWINQFPHPLFNGLNGAILPANALQAWMAQEAANSQELVVGNRIKTNNFVAAIMQPIHNQIVAERAAATLQQIRQIPALIAVLTPPPIARLQAAALNDALHDELTGLNALYIPIINFINTYDPVAFDPIPDTNPVVLNGVNPANPLSDLLTQQLVNAVDNLPVQRHKNEFVFIITEKLYNILDPLQQNIGGDKPQYGRRMANLLRQRNILAGNGAINASPFIVSLVAKIDMLRPVAALLHGMFQRGDKVQFMGRGEEAYKPSFYEKFVKFLGGEDTDLETCLTEFEGGCKQPLCGGVDEWLNEYDGGDDEESPFVKMDIDDSPYIGGEDLIANGVGMAMLGVGMYLGLMVLMVIGVLLLIFYTTYEIYRNNSKCSGFVKNMEIKKPVRVLSKFTDRSLKSIPKQPSKTLSAAAIKFPRIM